MIRVTLKRSRSLAVLLTAAHIAAIATLLPLDLPIWARVSAVLAIVASLVRSVFRHALLRSSRCLCAIELREKDEAAVQIRDGTWHAARVLGTSYVSPFVSVINLRVEGRIFAQHMLVVPDNAEPEYFRRLRVWLRWGYRMSR